MANLQPMSISGSSPSEQMKANALSAKTVNVPVQVSAVAPKTLDDLVHATDANTEAILAGQTEINNVPSFDTGVKKKLKITTQTVSSATGGTPEPITVHMFNEDKYGATPTNNGSGGTGGGAVTTTYNDGFNGVAVNALAASKGEVGIKYRQFKLKIIDIATGLQDSISTAAANPQRVRVVGDSTTETDLFALALADSPKNFQDGFLVLNVLFSITNLDQITYTLPAGKTAIATCTPLS